MRSRNPDGPWNPERPTEISPEEFERQVLRWLQESEGEPTDVEVGHLEKIAGTGGEYKFDVAAKFTRFSGAEFTVVVECKHHGRAVERELVQVLHSKLNDVKAQKAMMFSTSGYQKGAMEYASAYNIALLTLKDGHLLYETRDQGPPREPPPWVDLPRFFGERLVLEEAEGSRRWRVRRVQDGDVRAIDEFLADA